MPTISTVMDEHERRVLDRIAEQRKWSTSQVIAECVRESKSFLEMLASTPPPPTNGQGESDRAK